MNTVKYKTIGLICILIQMILGAVFLSHGILSGVIYGVIGCIIGVLYWFFALGFTPDADGKSWELFVPFTVICIAGCFLFGSGFSHPCFCVSVAVFSLDCSLVFFRKESRPGGDIFRIYGIGALACVLLFALWLFTSGGIL